MKSNDQKLLEECYQQICESTREPLYLGVEKDKERWMKWLSKLKHEVHEDGSVSVKQDVYLNSIRMYGRLPFNFNQIQGGFFCVASNIETLKGAPRYVTGGFSHDKFSDEDYRSYIKFHKLRDKLPEIEGIF
jgi:hypothetical protein